MSFTYEEQNKAIFRDAIIFSVVSFAIEVIFFLFYYFASLFTYGIKTYIVKNLIMPSSINIISISLGYYIYKKNISKTVNDWCAATVIAIPACVISLFHCSYPEITLCMIIPLSLSTLFNNKHILKSLLCLFVVTIISACLISILSHDFSVVIALMHYMICLAIIICCYIATRILLKASSDKVSRIMKYKSNEEKLNDLIKKDSITELYNNMAIKATIKLNLEERNDSMIVSMIDIDDFKQINDTHGHTFGDKVISYLAVSLKEISNSQIVCSRYGGDEFLIASIDYPIEVIKSILRKIISDFENHFKNIGITLSCGIASYSDDITNELDFINKADAALYQVKNSGKNDIIIK